MVWAKVDDRLHSSTKWRLSSKGARALWTTALSWCAADENDGFVPASMLQVLEGTKAEAKSLVDAGLWEIVEDKGWRFRNWSKWEPTKAQLNQKRQAEKERIAEARAARKDKSTSRQPAEVLEPTPKQVGDVLTPTSRQPAEVLALPRPDPTRPDPLKNETPDGVSKKSAAKGTRIPDGFALTSEMRTWGRQKAPDVNVDTETENFIDWWRSKPGTAGLKLDWVATWRTWMRNEQKRRTPQLSSKRHPGDDYGLEYLRFTS